MKITLKAARGYHVLDAQEILYAKAEARYVRVFLREGEELLVFHTLRELELKLGAGARHGPLLFLLTHRTYLVAFHHVLRMEGKQQLVLSTEVGVPISKHRLPELLRASGAIQHPHDPFMTSLSHSPESLDGTDGQSEGPDNLGANG